MSYAKAGVAVPVSQLRGASGRPVEPGKVVGAVPVQYVAVQYGDERGQLVKEIWLRVGEDYFKAPDAEGFVHRLRRIRDKQAAQIDALLSALSSTAEGGARLGDDVDVVSTLTVEEMGGQ